MLTIHFVSRICNRSCLTALGLALLVSSQPAVAQDINAFPEGSAKQYVQQTACSVMQPIFFRSRDAPKKTGRKR